MRVLILWISLLAAISTVPADAVQQTPKMVVADFNGSRLKTNLGEDFGTWDRDPNDATQGCRMKVAKTDALENPDGSSIQLDYDVDSPNPAYNGFWLKLQKANAVQMDTLSFYVKGDDVAGFPLKMKFELKDKMRGKATFVIENITAKWQRVSLSINPNSKKPGESKPFEEFVVVFDDATSSPKSGRVYIDQIEFSKQEN